MAFIYEIRSANSTVLKRDDGFPTQDAAKIAGREDAPEMKNICHQDRPYVGRFRLYNTKGRLLTLDEM